MRAEIVALQGVTGHNSRKPDPRRALTPLAAALVLGGLSAKRSVALRLFFRSLATLICSLLSCSLNLLCLFSLLDLRVVRLRWRLRWHDLDPP